MHGPGPANWRETDLVSFDFLLGPYAGVVKRVAGVGGGARKSRTFFFIFLTLRSRNKFSRTLDITTKVCLSRPNFSWQRGLAESELSRSIPCLPLSRFGNTEGHGLGGWRTHLGRKGMCLTERCCAPQSGYTPLHWASRYGHATVVEHLLAAGAIKDAKTKVRRAGDEGCK